MEDSQIFISAGSGDEYFEKQFEFCISKLQRFGL